MSTRTKTQQRVAAETQQGLRDQYATPGKDEGSKAARALFYNLMETPLEVRRGFFEGLGERDVAAALRAAAYEAGTPYALWQDDPYGFTRQVIGESVWSKQREVLEAIPNHKRVAVPSAFGTGKCVGRAERIPLADGRVVAAQDLVGTNFEVLAWREDGAQIARPARAGWNRIEPVLRLRTTGGREIVRNAEHPLWAAHATVSAVEGDRERGAVTLTPEARGWTPVGDLRSGDLVLAPMQHCAEGDQSRDRDHVALLGYLLGDGDTTSRHQITFTQQDGDALDEFRAICDRLDVDLAPKREQPCCYRLRGRIRIDGRRHNEVLSLAREWGLCGRGAREKCLPDWAWTLPNEQLAILLGRLFACDGWAHTRTARGGLTAEVAITLASEALIRDVEHAMLRLGVPGTVRKRRIKCDDGYNEAWSWSCTDRDVLADLPDLLDVPGKNVAMRRVADAVVATGTTRRRLWPFRNAPPGYRWERVASVETLPAQMTVSIEVDGEHTFVTSLVEHNTHLAARAALWRSLVHPPGTSLTVTTATRFRQVVRQLWPHIRTAVAKANLPLIADQTQLSAFDRHGTRVQIAYGFSAPPHDEAAVQGIHAPRLFIVVDEAGGISRIIGSAMRGLMTGEDTRLLAIGNPPTDDEGSWFEQLCEDERVRTIPISAYDAPMLTGERTQRCRACPSEVPAHQLGVHLVDSEWIEGTLADYGSDAPFVTAKVHAKFPKGGPSRTIPSDWIAIACRDEDPEEFDETFIRLCDLGLDDEQALVFRVQYGSWIRLGVDVAADGGDEMVIARSIGDVGHIVHSSTGSANVNAVDVAGKVLVQIKRAERLRKALGTTAPIRVKIDGIGVGWGVASVLEAWRSEGIHDAEIVSVIVSEDTYRKDEAETLRPNRKRDEMWLTGRSLMQPHAHTGYGSIRLVIDKRTRTQLAAPTYATSSAGRTVIETKKHLRARGVASPDRAEAVLMVFYEPIVKNKGGTFRVIV